mgnify:CR=1 FL=1|jgi:hypothetical protein
MPYRLLADLVVAVHFLWVVFLIIGALWGRRHRGVRALHLGGLGFAVFIQVFGLYCPLTYLELWLRQRHEPSGAYPGSFIIHYAEELLYMELSRELIFLLSLALVGFNAWVYFFKRPLSRK